MGDSRSSHPSALPTVVGDPADTKEVSSKDALEDMKNSRQILLAKVKQRGLSLEDASKGEKNDEEIVLAAVQQDGISLMCASEDMKNNKKIVLAAVQQDGWSLKYASDEMKNNKEIVLAAVQQYGVSLEFASLDMKNDEEIVLAAVQQDGRSLKFASKEMLSNEMIVLAAVQEDECSFELASPDQAAAIRSCMKKFGYGSAAPAARALATPTKIVQIAVETTSLEGDSEEQVIVKCLLLNGDLIDTFCFSLNAHCSAVLTKLREELVTPLKVPIASLRIVLLQSGLLLSDVWPTKPLRELLTP